MSEASYVFEESIEWLRQNYIRHRFYVERDIVWTIQLRLSVLIEARPLPLRVFNDYPILPGNRRGLCADIVLLDEEGQVEVAAEFKYEPSHARNDIWPTKFPVVSWSDDGVAGDVKRAHEFVEQAVCRVAYSIFVDEGRAFRYRAAHPGSAWDDWKLPDGSLLPSVLWSKVEHEGSLKRNG